MSVKAVEREVHLSQRRLAQQLMPVLGDQRAVGRDVDLEPLLMADIQQLVDLRMKQRLSLHMQINVTRMRLDLIQSSRKVLHFNEVGLALRRRTERAGQITNARDFYVNFLKRLQDVIPNPMSMIVWRFASLFACQSFTSYHRLAFTATAINAIGCRSI